MRRTSARYRTAVTMLSAIVIVLLIASCSASGGKPTRAADSAVSQKVYLIGHRGAAGLAPENTLAGFQRACEIGVDGIITNRPDIFNSIRSAPRSEK